MRVKNEQIAELKKNLRRQKYTDIKGESVFLLLIGQARYLPA